MCTDHSTTVPLFNNSWLFDTDSGILKKPSEWARNFLVTFLRFGDDYCG